MRFVVSSLRAFVGCLIRVVCCFGFDVFVVCRWLFVVTCLLLCGRVCSLSIGVCCVLFVVRCSLFGVCCLLFVVHCPLFVVGCLVCCLLFVVWCLSCWLDVACCSCLE